jgi:hypothetical protein
MVYKRQYQNTPLLKSGFKMLDQTNDFKRKESVKNSCGGGLNSLYNEILSQRLNKPAEEDFVDSSASSSKPGTSLFSMS